MPIWSPAIYEWNEDEDNNGDITYTLSSVELASGYAGSGCTEDSASVTVVAAKCTNAPTISVECWSGHDAALASGSNDVSSQQSKKYTFDASSGYLTDSTTSYEQDSFPDDEQHYGVFFEDVADNYRDLVCEWDDSRLCHWKAYENIDTFYEYNTGGDYSNRVTLIDSVGDPVVVSKPAVMTYEHSGSTSNSGRDYSGSMFLLEYRGQGEGLDGLPTYCIDPSTGAEVEATPGTLPVFSTSTSPNRPRSPLWKAPPVATSTMPRLLAFRRTTRRFRR